MPWSQLLLPLLGGYIFVNVWHRTAFRAQRIKGRRLIFEAAIAGAGLAIVAWLIVLIVRWSFPPIISYKQVLLPDTEYLGTAFLAFLLGFFSYPLNWRTDRVKWEREALLKTSQLEHFLDEVFWNAQPIAITLESRKVYVGMVTDTPDVVTGTTYVRLLPLQSGYREVEDNALVLTNDYAELLEKIVDENPDFAHLNVNDLEVVLPVSQIVSINPFDYRIHRALDGN